MSQYPSPYEYGGSNEPRTPYPPSAMPAPPPPAVSDAHVVVSWIFTVCGAFYFLPWSVAATRRSRATVPILLVNLFTGWTIVGWVVSLIWACTAKDVDARPAALPASAPFPSTPSLPAAGYGPTYAASPYASPSLPTAPGSGNPSPAYPATPPRWQQPEHQPPTLRYPTDEFPTQRQ